ncbi:TPA: hypothetical protein ACVY43_000793 [Klebsiella michiganensis]
MTTDITELAQREKFEAWAEEAGALPWGILKKHRNQDGSYPGPHYTYMWKAWQAASAELVEALEKAQQRIVELDRKNCELDSLTQRWAVERAENADRIAELESRAVTFKLPSTPEPSAFAPWVAKAFYQFHKDTVKSCVAVFSDACRAAGIKVEAE